MTKYNPVNEPVLSYTPGSFERSSLQSALTSQLGQTVEIPAVIGSRRLFDGDTDPLVCPHDHRHTLGRVHRTSATDMGAAIAACESAHRDWSRQSFDERAAIFLRAADLLAGPWRQKLNAATMLGQSKTVQQAEIDSACELIDFLRFNVAFAQRLHDMQPFSPPGMRNTQDYRPLEGFVYAVTPFNFTAIGGNLACAPALMGNTVIWKPAASAALSNYLVLELLEAAGLPAGVINFVPGDPILISDAVLAASSLAGIHFTGSTDVFDLLWRSTAERLASYRNYPRLVGETGGKNFVLAHASADPAALSTALLRGAFEYQGQKCSAASRAYIPASVWPEVKQRLLDDLATLTMGDIAEFSHFMGAVIDRRAFERIKGYLDRSRNDGSSSLLAGGGCDDRIGYFVEPTVIQVTDPQAPIMCNELFGPVLSVFIYQESQWDEVLNLVEATSKYGLTGAIFANERAAIRQAADVLRFAAGNFYVNDKPTGAVVGQQPFGGARRSGTNDKAGSVLNLTRWVSVRTTKETYVPSHAYAYPHMMRGVQS
jgi:1-pyrroline-5-carboxylate dehydrogenase